MEARGYHEGEEKMIKLGTVTGHKISWWVWEGSTKIPRTSHMSGTWGYDVKCECGWETRTGGAVKSYILDEIFWHKLEAKREQETSLPTS